MAKEFNNSTTNFVGTYFDKFWSEAMASNRPFKWLVSMATNKFGDKTMAVSNETTFETGRAINRDGDDQIIISNDWNASVGKTLSTSGVISAASSFTIVGTLDSFNRYVDERETTSNRHRKRSNRVVGGSSLSTSGLAPK